MKVTLSILFTFIVVIHGNSQTKIGILDHNHIALQVKDVPASAKFYTDVLQLESVPVPDNLKAIRAWFKVGNYQIHLLDGRTEPLHDDRNGRHLALFVSSIEDASKYLDQKGVNYHSQVRFDGVKQLYFSDPDGHLIELNQK